MYTLPSPGMWHNNSWQIETKLYGHHWMYTLPSPGMWHNNSWQIETKLYGHHWMYTLPSPEMWHNSWQIETKVLGITATSAFKMEEPLPEILVLIYQSKQ